MTIQLSKAACVGAWRGLEFVGSEILPAKRHGQVAALLQGSYLLQGKIPSNLDRNCLPFLHPIRMICFFFQQTVSVSLRRIAQKCHHALNDLSAKRF